VNARMEVGDFEQLMDVHWADDEQEREPLAGLIFDRIGRIPDVGDELWIEGVKFTVLEIENQRLARIKVERESVGIPGTPVPDAVTTDLPTQP
ncbi:MAG: hypothetical protein LC793_16180, partial [Thermomicrobia bacterium]|nr:hypothetical protein [Thermomicrobia bacterium]